MTVWSKLLSALRGGANEVGEAIVDSQALRILDQEIRDADVELRKSREALASIMARHRLAQERVEKGAAQVAEYEQYAIKALEAGNEELAREVAEKIATLENQLEGERAQVAEFAASVAQLRKSVSQAEGNIRQLKQQVDTVKATESVQKAQMAVAQRYGNSKSKLQTAVDSRFAAAPVLAALAFPPERSADPDPARFHAALFRRHGVVLWQQRTG